MTPLDPNDLWLVVVTGWTGAGKSTTADALATELSATVVSFDWVMSALRSHESVWAQIGEPVEFQRRVGWDLMSRVAEQQLRGRRSCILDLVAREEIRCEWEQLANRHDASFAVIECVCHDLDTHRSRIIGRQRQIPGWYELDWEHVERGRQYYQPLADPKVVIDAGQTLTDNLHHARQHLAEQSRRLA